MVESESMDAPLPTIDGIAPSRVTVPEGFPDTVLAFLERRFPGVGRHAWISRIDAGKVVDEAGSVLSPDSPCRAGLILYYYRDPGAEEAIPFEEEVLCLDDHIVVADKPHFLPVAPAGRFLRETLLVRLKMRLHLEHLVPLHRIDRETAGLVLFSRNPATRALYAELFRRGETEKVYEALAPASPKLDFPIRRVSRITAGEPFFRMKEVDGPPNSETLVELMEISGKWARYRLTPRTGKKHQLRLHMAALGIPILNDPLYPDLIEKDPGDYRAPLKLLAKELRLKDPLTGADRTFVSRRTLG